MAQIIFLGTSSSVPTKDRDNTSFLFIHRNSRFLVDCPGAISQKLLKVGADFKKIKNLIITHEHPDHIYGIVSLIHTQMFFNDRLNIFSNTTCIKIIKQLVKTFQLNKKNYPQLNYINVFRKNIFFNKGNLSLQAIKNSHSKDSFGIKFSFGKKTVFFSSDTAFTPQMLKKAGFINYLIHDCTASSSYFSKHPKLRRMHTPASKLALYMATKPRTKLIPIHFLLLDSNEMQRIKSELRVLGRNLLFVKDFQSLSL